LAGKKLGSLTQMDESQDGWNKEKMLYFTYGKKICTWGITKAWQVM